MVNNVTPTAPPGIFYQAAMATVNTPNWCVYNSSGGQVYCDYSGTGSPAGTVIANVGSTYHNLSGGGSTTTYNKISGSGASTGWSAVTTVP
jgi:hypothetical protein